MAERRAQEIDQARLAAERRLQEETEARDAAVAAQEGAQKQAALEKLAKEQAETAARQEAQRANDLQKQLDELKAKLQSAQQIKSVPVQDASTDSKLAQNLSQLKLIEFQPSGQSVKADIQFPKTQADFELLKGCKDYYISKIRRYKTEAKKTSGWEIFFQNGKSQLIGTKVDGTFGTLTLSCPWPCKKIKICDKQDHKISF